MSLKFYFGCMGSSKTANALMQRFNYIEKGMTVLLLKPSVDTRDGSRIIKSRIGLEAECEVFNQNVSIMDIYSWNFIKPDILIVDEVNFCTKQQIESLKCISASRPVYCYGLRTDFQSNLFEGSKRLMELADEIHEIESICHCGNTAIINARVLDGEITYDGEQVDIGGNEKYIGLCYECWQKGNIQRGDK